MKVCLLAFSSLRVAPYVRKYINILEQNHIPYDVISREYKADVPEQIPINHFIEYYNDAHTVLQKAVRFKKYRNFVGEVLEERRYDRVIAFTALGAYLNKRSLLSRQYKGKYIIDIRDYSKCFSSRLFCNSFQRLAKSAYAVMLSSRGFLDWFPDHGNVYMVHNLPNSSAPEETPLAFGTDKIRIGYLGGIGYLEPNMKIADAFANSDRFSLLYAGNYPKKYNIRDYCREHSIRNTDFYGEYSDAEKRKLYDYVDIINAVYGNDSLTVRSALPNKLYDCIYYKKPIMVCAHTYLADVVLKYHLGFPVDPWTDDILRATESYLKSFDSQAFLDGCHQYLALATAEQEKADELFRQFIGIR